MGGTCTKWSRSLPPACARRSTPGPASRCSAGCAALMGRSAMQADPAAGCVVPAVLRGARFVPLQAPGRREPARVSARAFQAAGLPVPDHPGQRNIYQLTARQGLAWTPGLDAQIRRRGGELLGHGHLILVDIDSPAAVDGSPLVNAVAGWPTARWRPGPCWTCRPPCPCTPQATPQAGTCPGGTCGTGPTPPAQCTWARWAAATPSNCAPGAPAPDHRGTWSARTPMSCRPCPRGSPTWPGRPPHRPPPPAPATAARTPTPGWPGIVGRLRTAPPRRTEPAAVLGQPAHR